VFCGRIPRDLYEYDLIPLFEKWGTIRDLRLMMDPLTNLNKGYAFVTYATKEEAQEAVKQVVCCPEIRLFPCCLSSGQPLTLVSF
jgi:heterogeneous nuclear ribonucleoprotein R